MWVDYCFISQTYSSYGYMFKTHTTSRLEFQHRGEESLYVPFSRILAFDISWEGKSFYFEDTLIGKVPVLGWMTAHTCTYE